MKKQVINLLLLLLLNPIVTRSNSDSTFVKKGFHTLELCIGISPKAKRQYVISTKGLVMYGLWYDYSIKVKNNFFAAFIFNPLIGGDQIYTENFGSNYFSSEKNKENYLLLNIGLGIKYKINLSKPSKKQFLIFSVGDLFSYKYVYKQSSMVQSTLYNPPYSSIYSHTEYYNLKNNRLRFNSFNCAFPVFLKLSYVKDRFSFSLTQYLFTHQTYYGTVFFKRLYTNLNIGITL